MVTLPWTLGIAIAGALVPLHGYGLYCLALVGGSRFAKLRRRPSAPSPPPRIAVLIAAHDEEAVIGRCVHSLLEQTYPRERYEIIVVADRCADGTAQAARCAGARVLERIGRERTGKTAALLFALRDAVLGANFDAVAVFDADNVVDRAFLSKVGERLSTGERVVQGYVDSKNPSRSWVAASSALGFYAIAAVAQAPREALGLSAPMMGTGWAARLEDAARVMEHSTSLADDLEALALLTRARVRVAYEGSAKVADEKPAYIGAAIRQRHRWMQGRWAVAGRELFPILRIALCPRARGGGPDLAARARAFDVAVQLVSPSLLFTAVCTGLISVAGILVAAAGPQPLLGTVCFASLVVSASYYGVPALLIRKLRPPTRVWGFYAIQPVYIVLSVPLAVSGFLRRRSTRWRRTEHDGMA